MNKNPAPDEVNSEQPSSELHETTYSLQLIYSYTADRTITYIPGTWYSVTACTGKYRI